MGEPFLVSVVDENNFSKLGRICLEIVCPGPLCDVMELGLPTAVVNSAGMTIYVLSTYLTSRLPGVTLLRSASPTTKDAGSMADPWMTLAVIPSTDDSTPRYWLLCEWS